jgi:hypothetical protein
MFPEISLFIGRDGESGCSIVLHSPKSRHWLGMSMPVVLCQPRGIQFSDQFKSRLFRQHNARRTARSRTAMILIAGSCKKCLFLTLVPIKYWGKFSALIAYALW